MTSDHVEEWDCFWDSLEKGDLTGLSADTITRVIYSAAISFCCYVDIHKDGDQKMPGTFFELDSLVA